MQNPIKDDESAFDPATEAALERERLLREYFAQFYFEPTDLDEEPTPRLSMARTVPRKGGVT